MAATDPFDLVRRLGTLPLGPLVDALRQLHSTDTGHPSRLDALLAAREEPAARDASRHARIVGVGIKGDGHFFPKDRRKK